MYREIWKDLNDPILGRLAQVLPSLNFFTQHQNLCCVHTCYCTTIRDTIAPNRMSKTASISLQAGSIPAMDRILEKKKM